MLYKYLQVSRHHPGGHGLKKADHVRSKADAPSPTAALGNTVCTDHEGGVGRFRRLSTSGPRTRPEPAADPTEYCYYHHNAVVSVRTQYGV